MKEDVQLHPEEHVTENTWSPMTQEERELGSPSTLFLCLPIPRNNSEVVTLSCV